MSDSIDVPVYGPKQPGIVIKEIKWEVNEGDLVKQAQCLCHLKYEQPENTSTLLAMVIQTPIYTTRSIKIKSPITGKVRKIAPHQEIQANKVVCILEPCRHDTVFSGLCVYCGFQIEE